MPVLEATFAITFSLQTAFNTPEDSGAMLDAGEFRIRYEGTSTSAITPIRLGRAAVYEQVEHFKWSFQQDGSQFSPASIEGLLYTPEDSRLNDPEAWVSGYSPLGGNYASVSFVGITNTELKDEGETGSQNSESSIGEDGEGSSQDGNGGVSQGTSGGQQNQITITALRDKVNSLESQVTSLTSGETLNGTFRAWLNDQSANDISSSVMAAPGFDSGLSSIVNGMVASAMAGYVTISAFNAYKGVVSNQIAGVLSNAKSLINNGLKPLASMGQTLASVQVKANKVDGLLTQLGKVRGTAQNALQKGTQALTKANAASSVASAASGLAKTASTAISSLTSILSVVGGAAGIVSAIGLLTSVLPSLRANESRMDSFNNALSQNLSLIGKVKNAADRALTFASSAMSAADSAGAQATAASIKANQAGSIANNAQAVANSAMTRARDAQIAANAALTEARNRVTEVVNTNVGVPAMTPGQFQTLRRQNNAAIGQNNRIINLLQGLPTDIEADVTFPPELLGMPGALAGIKADAAAAARQTTKSNLVSAAATATCQSFRGGGCGDQALRRRFRGLDQFTHETTKNFDALGSLITTGISLKIDQLIQITFKFRNRTYKKFDQTWDFLKMDRVLNAISTAATIHNGAMLSRDLVASMVASVDGIIGLAGFRDAEGQPFSLASQISGGVTAVINRTIGAEAAAGISAKWNSWNRIISAASNVVMALRSVQYAIAEGVEIGLSWTAKIGNGLRESGTVNDRQWPWMRENVNVKRISRLDRLNEGLQTAEGITQEVYNTVAAGAEIVNSVNDLRIAKHEFDTVMEEERTKGDDEMTERNTESESPDIEQTDYIRLEEDEAEEE